METLIDIASSFGAPGLIVLGAGWYVVSHDRQCNAAHKEMQDRHTEERKELVAVLERQHSEALAAGQKYVEAYNNNTAVMARLETIITNRIHE